MPTPPLTEQDMRAAVEAFKANGFNKALAAEALSLKPSTFDHRYIEGGK